MNDVVLGLLGIAVGLLFCFRGYLAMRLVIPIWGAFTGFVLGAGIVAGATSEGFLAGLLSWLVGIAVGVLFGMLAYLYYEVSVFVAMAAIGFMLGASLAVGLGVEWTWVVVLAGVVAGMALAAVAIAGDLPMLLLTVLTAAAGASAAVGGLMLLVGTVDASDVDDGRIIDAIRDAPGWWFVYAALVVVGIVVQLRTVEEIRGGLRARWAAEGGRSFRPE